MGHDPTERPSPEGDGSQRPHSPEWQESSRLPLPLVLPGDDNPRVVSDVHASLALWSSILRLGFPPNFNHLQQHRRDSASPTKFLLGVQLNILAYYWL